EARAEITRTSIPAVIAARVQRVHAKCGPLALWPLTRKTAFRFPRWNQIAGYALVHQTSGRFPLACRLTGRVKMSLGTILIIILIIFLLGGFSGRFGGYGYGMGHSGMGLGGAVLIVLIILLLLGKL